MKFLDAFADTGPLSRLLGRVEGDHRTDAFALAALGSVPLVVVLVLLENDLFERVLLFAAAVVFALAVGLGCAVPMRGRASWLVPALLRAVEYGTVIRVTAVVAPEQMPIAYAYLAVLAYHHYDTVYRSRHTGAPPPEWVFLVGGGVEGRLLVIAALAMSGSAALAVGLGALAGWLAVVFVTESVAGWLQWTRQTDVATNLIVKEELD